MCGIAGYLMLGQSVRSDILDQMNLAIRHRGPDANDTWIDGESRVGLTHCRLAIIDLDARSNQPFFDHSRRYVIVFNGEIYNYLELRKELIERGARFYTDSDTEVIVEAFKFWGEKCLSRLNGMFAFAIWDIESQTMLLARDRIGKKPLFYSRIEPPRDNSNITGFGFASEPSALKLIPQVNTEFADTAMQAFLMLGYSTGEQTCWQGIKRLLPGHAMLLNLVSPERPRIWCYYNLIEYFESSKEFAPDEIKEQLIGLFDASVKCRLQSDVPYGLFLSSGVDSAAVLASMAETKSDSKIQTFNIGFTEDSFDESLEASIVAEQYNTEHHQYFLHPSQSDFEEFLQSASNEPIADASILPMYKLSKEARNHVKMVLMGDGGDELFAGYPTYIADSLHRSVAPLLPAKAWEKISLAYEKIIPTNHKRMNIYFKLQQFLRGLPMDSRRAHFSWRIVSKNELWKALFSKDFLCSFDWESVYNIFDCYYEDAKHLSPLNQSLYVDMKTWMVDSILVKVDRATMAHGLEARSPLLDHRMVELAASIPPEMKLKLRWNGFDNKAIFREIQSERLGKDFLKRPKRGFNVPVSSWFNEQLKDQLSAILANSITSSIFNSGVLRDLFNEHHRGTKDHGLTLLNIAILTNWMTKNSQR